MVKSLAVSIPSINVHGGGGGVMTSNSGAPSPTAIGAFTEIPLTALSTNSKRQLSNLLNTKKVLHSEDGYERDWRGIATLAHQKSLCNDNVFREDPISTVLLLWCKNNPKTATFFYLESFLGLIDRWDVCDDIYENLVEDAKNYTAREQKKALALVDSDRDTQAQPIDTTDDVGCRGSNRNILTVDDVICAQKGLPLQRYDAFVLYADADIDYIDEMLKKLEDDPEYNLRLCLKNRDLLIGNVFEHVAITQLIEERCKHLVVILTEAFLKSEENKFLVHYTQALQIEHNTRKILPLLYEDLIIPRTLKIYTHMKYNATLGNFYDFWGKLASSLKDVDFTPENLNPVLVKDAHNAHNLSVERHQQQQQQQQQQQLKMIQNLPTAPTENPTISINGHAFVSEEDIPKKKKNSKYRKRPSLHGNGDRMHNGSVMRHAHSTSQLNTVYNKTEANSLTNLSTNSGDMDTLKKKKKFFKHTSKIFKIFSRSTSKLEVAT